MNQTAEFEIRVYNLDTVSTITSRIVAHIPSLVKFCIITPASPLTKENLNALKKRGSLRVGVWDGISACVGATRITGYTLDRFLKNNRAQIDQLDIEGELASVWFYEKTAPFERDKIFELLVDGELDRIKEAVPNVDSLLAKKGILKLSFESSKAWNMSLRDQIRLNKTTADRLETTYKIQLTIAPVPTTEFEEERVKIVFQTNVENLSIYEIFNSIILLSDFPIAILNNFYKVFKGTRISLEWIESSVWDKISIKYTPKTVKEHIDIEFELRNNVLFISTEIEPKETITVDYMAQLLPRLMPSINVKMVKHTFENVTGVFYIPLQDLNIYVFEHLVINDPKFSNFLIDESEKASRAKTSIYVYFEGTTELVSMIVTPKIMEKYDPTMRDKSLAVFPIGLPFLRVRVMKVKDKENIDSLKDSFARSMVIYNRELPVVIDFYNRYIPGFGQQKRDKKKPEKGDDEIKFRKLDPELFSSKYTRSCPNRPEILTEAELEGLDPQMTMLYPKTPGEGPQHYYTCQRRDDDYKFIGLKRADAQITKYRYVPCCFKTDQKIGNTPYKQYFKEEEKEDRVVQQRLITGTKFVEYDRYGTIDDFIDISSLFVDLNPDFVYRRWGVDRGTRSFIQCIVEATNYESYNVSTFETRQYSLNAIIQEIVNDDELIKTARQSLFNKSDADIRDMLTDVTSYQSPSVFTQLFEQKFNCKIFTFSPSGLIVPRSAKTFLQDKLDDEKKVVFILEHTGSSPLLTPYPRCEVLVRTNRGRKSDVLFLHDSGNRIALIVKDMFRQMTSAYFGTMQSNVIDVPDELFAESKSQVINSYGTTMALVTKDDFLIYLSEPITPQKMPESRGEYVLRPLEVTLRYVADKFRGGISTVYGNNNTILGVKVVLLNYTFYIPTKSVANTQPTMALNLDIPDTDDKSLLHTFNQYQKMAKYLVEMMLFLFSEYLEAKKIVDINDRVIEQFVKEKVSIVPDMKYSLSSRFFESAKRNFTRGGKLAVKSPEMLKRLVFTLRINVVQRTQELFEYRKRTSIETYMVDLLDFENYPQQIILEGRESVLKYIHSKFSTFQISKSVALSTTPYFFQNLLIGPDVYLAIDAITLQEAMSIANNWSKTRFIDGFPIDVSPVIWNVYIYNSELDIHPAGKNETDEPIKLLLYKIEEDEEDVGAFTVLIKF